MLDTFRSNGLVFFVADFLGLDVDNSFRHSLHDKQPKPECLYDFGWNKAGIDIGMRSSLICPQCINRINKMNLSEQQNKIFSDLRLILNDLGNASKWDTDVIEYWETRVNLSNEPEVDTIIRNQVFISYSHVDAEWLQRFRVHLKPFERNAQINVWDDTKIRVGQDWKQEITQALKKTKIAVLLISANFLASDFIASNELPPLLEAAEKDGAIIMPIILSPCGITLFSDLSRFQSVNPPSKTLEEMTKGEQERFLLRLTEEILKQLPG
jgi:hypothetical protein